MPCKLASCLGESWEVPPFLTNIDVQRHTIVHVQLQLGKITEQSSPEIIIAVIISLAVSQFEYCGIVSGEIK